MSTSSMECELRPVARARIATQLLPRERPRQILAGWGCGKPCDLCDRSITSAEVEYEIHETRADHAVSYRFHIACQAIWQLELPAA
ncbi:MAG: hypothetical protein JOZ93_01755 [Sinobacteraceae bacterium]|nr:hypothetical protein [Nevskiaceae bacterium]MBV9911266.1 hypothetical protein [Nevskiaceae bacterium]